MLAQCLSSISSARDAARLFAAVGYRATDEPFADGARVIGRWKTFKIVALDATNPMDAVRSLARRLGGSGERALAVAIGGHEICLAAPRAGVAGSRVLSVSRARPDPDALQLLAALRPGRGKTPLEHALRVADLLSTERAGERFFTAFRVMFERMSAALDRRHQLADRRMVAMLALTRVLFLYFVQAKGWLAGQPGFLRDLLDTCLARRRHFHRTALNPLFFGTLNRPVADRSSAARRLGSIPYLNGGLFEPHAAERRMRVAALPNAIWRDAFDQLFERFRFCVREAHEVDAIAPDMLGHVFERLMDDGERHDTGTFYTPESVVRRIVDSAIATALAGAGGLDDDVARRVVALQPIPANHHARALRAVRSLRLLDPAVGSGAFLLGALERLTLMRLTLAPSGTAPDRCRERREVLRDNLFGVDVNPMAVRLAELRLWLAVVADDPAESVAGVTPLPNLNGVVRQGETLFDPLAAVRALGGAGRPPALDRRIEGLRAARTALYAATGAARRRALEQLDAAERDLATPLIEHAIRGAEATLRDLGAAQQSRDLFGKRLGLGRDQRRRHRATKSQRAELQRWLRRLEDHAVPFFSFDVHAADTLAAGGFSVVVGNPPWIRAERLSPGMREALSHRFSWWKSEGARGFAHRPDLAVAFLQRALELTAPGGAVGMLVPSKVTTAGYGETARGQLVRETTVTYLHRVSDADARRFAATTYPLAIVVRNARPPAAHQVRLQFDGDGRLPQSSLARPGAWLLVSDRAQGALQEFLDGGTALGALAPAFLGVKTGADRLFVARPVSRSDGETVLRLNGDDVAVESELVRPAIRGRDVRPFGCRPQWAMVWTHETLGTPRRELPPLASHHFAIHRRALERRSDYRGGPIWTVFRTAGSARGHRVVWPDIARRPRAVMLDATEFADAIPLNTCYVAAFADRHTALIATTVLNSVWAAALVAATADEARGGYRRINARVIERMPLPLVGNPGPLARLGTRAHRPGGVPAHVIDVAVADALDLSTDARAALRRLATPHG